MPLLEGYATGLALIILIGPVLFVLVQSTIERGRAYGAAVAIGIFVSDIIAVALVAYGAAEYFEDPRIQPWIALAGGVLVLALGIRYLVRPGMKAKDTKLEGKGLAVFFVKGFSVNFINPFVFLVWIGVVGAATARHGYDVDLVWYCSGAVLGILTLDLAKVFFAHKLTSLLKPRTLKWIFRISGVLMILFAARLLLFAAGLW